MQCIGLRGKIVGPTFLEGGQVHQLPAQRRQLLGVSALHSTMASVMPSVSNKRHTSNRAHRQAGHVLYEQVDGSRAINGPGTRQLAGHADKTRGLAADSECAFQSRQTALRRCDLAVHQHGQKPVAEFCEVLVFHASRKHHLVVFHNYLVIFSE